MPFWRRASTQSVDEGAWIVVGLGNPGREYEGTRHNVGFMVVDRLAQRTNMQLRSSKHRADIGRGTIGGESVIVAEPKTFMNESGNAVSRLVAYYRVPLHRLLIVCDDIDIPFGTLRIRPDGSPGGNNGLRSIVQSVGTSDFPRLRLGVGRPQHDAVRHVLGAFPPAEKAQLPPLLDTACDAIESCIQDGVTAAMNRFNRDWLSL